MSNRKKIILTIFVFLVAVFGSPETMQAVNTDTVGILPANPDKNVRFSDAWFIYKLDLGEKKTDGIRVLNNKKETVVVKLYPVDATTTSDGSFALLPEDAEKKDAGAWIKLAVSEIELAPESEKTVPFEFTVPKNADAGDHMGGIIMQELETTGDVLSGTGVKIVTRVGVRLYETVPGAVEKSFEVTRFDWRLNPTNNPSWWRDFLDINKNTLFFVGIKNKGNVSLTPKVSLEVKNTFGQVVVNLPDQEIGTVFPRGETGDSMITWKGMPIIGRYTAKITTRFAEEGLGENVKEIVIWAIPYRMLFLLVILGVLLVLIRLIRKYFLEASKEKMPIYTVQKGDTLSRLAEKAMVPWKYMARVNDLRSPFEIRAGQKLFIPLNRKNRALMEKMVAGKFLGQSIAQTEGHPDGGRSKKIVTVIVILLLIGGGAIWGIRIRNKQMIHEEVKVPEKEVVVKTETDEKTRSGVFKKSSVKLALSSLPVEGGDAEANGRLRKRLELTGYKVELSSRSSEFEVTTIEYAPGKLEQAKMVQNDLGIKVPAELKEVADLEVDVMVHNLAGKEEFLNF